MPASRAHARRNAYIRPLREAAAVFGQSLRRAAAVLFSSTNHRLGYALGRLSMRLARPGPSLDPLQRRMAPLRRHQRFVRALAARIRSGRPARDGRLDRQFTHAGSVRSIAQDFRNAPILPGVYAGSEPAISGGDLHEAATRALRREVDLAGSGTIDLGRPICWHKDYISGYVWPSRPHILLELVPSGTGADCRFPWELGRCHHWTHLAADIENPAAATLELVEQFEEFAAVNPPGFGIQYTSAAEVAIRAANWLCAFRRMAGRLVDRDIELLCTEMHAAGKFIRAHLPVSGRGLNTYRYVASLLGLYTIGTMFPSLAQAGAWYRFAGQELGDELPHQFDADGAHREGSPAYGAMTIECYLYAYLLGVAATDPRVADWRDTLARAIDHLAALLLPDGRLPRIGDDDAGRLLEPPGEAHDDYRYLIQVGAVLFGRRDWKSRAGADPRPGLDFWLGPGGVDKYRTLACPPERCGTRLFRSAGLVIRRTPESVLVVQGGRRNARLRAHAHNDLTSVEYFADAERWLLDPGTYQVTRQPVWRDRFRSTGAHNVVQIDGAEQNRLESGWFYHLPIDAQPGRVEALRHQIIVGYRPAPGGTHGSVTRRIECSETGRVIQVFDRIEGEGIHRVDMGLNVPRRSFTYLAQDLLHFRGDGGHFLIYIPSANGFLTSITDSWYSPRYGVRERCFRVISTGHPELPVELHWRFAVLPLSEDPVVWAKSVRWFDRDHTAAGKRLQRYQAVEPVVSLPSSGSGFLVP